MTEIYIESRNEDGKRLVHHFESREALLKDLSSENPSMGDNHILLVVYGGLVIFSLLGRKERYYADTVRTMDVAEWFFDKYEEEVVV